MKRSLAGMIFPVLLMFPLVAFAGVPLDTVKANANDVLNALRDPKLQGEAGKKVKEAQKAHDAKVAAKYRQLAETEIKTLVVEDKWLATLAASVLGDVTLARALDRERIPGAGFRAAAFTPTFHKHAGQLCHGVQVHVSDRRRFPAFLTYLLLVHHARRQDPERFAWRDPPYEYEYVKLPFDILCGTNRVRKSIEAGVSPKRLAAGWKRESEAFRKRRAKYLLY